MARPCDFCLAQTSQGFGTLKKLTKYGWTPTVLISKASSVAASMATSPKSDHMQTLAYA